MSIVHKNRAVFSGLSCEWPTPQGLFDTLNEEFRFTLDVCASEKNHKCDTYYTINDNGLMKQWQPFDSFRHEVVWCNPPYGPDIEKWTRKAFQEWDNGRGPTVVMLLPARTDTIWWHEYALRATEIRFLKGRLRFGDGKGRATFPSCLVIFKTR